MEQNISKENPGDLNWRNKLEDVASLPGEALADKNATWEKLHSRLHQKSRRISPIWYWAAACLLLPVIIIPLVTINKDDSSVKINPAQIQSQKVTAPATPLNENTVADISPSPILKKKTTEQATQTNHKKPIPNGIVKGEENIPADINDEKNIQQQPAISADTISGTVETAVVSVKKKLKVVHINELADPGEEASNVVRYYEHHSFQVKLINQQVYSSPPLPSGGSGFNIFKTKKTPSN